MNTHAFERHVLIVDQSPHAREEIRRMLDGGSMRTYQITQAGTGEEALAACRDGATARIDAMLLDVDLPDMSALDVLASLGGSARQMPFPTIVVTRRAGRGDGAAALRAGAHDFIDKRWMSEGSLRCAMENAEERFCIQRDTHEARRRLEASEALARERLLALESAYATAPVGLCHTDRQYRCVHANAMLAEMDGVPRDEHIGRTPHEILPPEMANSVTENMRRVLEDGEPRVVIELCAEVRGAPGVVRDFWASYTPHHGLGGAVRGVNVVVQDITVQKETERELRRREERLRLALDVARIGFWDWDIDADEIHWSENLYALFGLSAATFEGTLDAFLATVHPDDRARVRSAIDATVAHGAPYEIEFRVALPGGSIRWAASQGRLQRDMSGRRRMTGVDMDVTARKDLDARRDALLAAEQAARREAERLGRLKDEFLATLSHEMRTPLNAIIGWAQILESNLTNEATVAKAVDVIARNAHAQAQMVSDLLDMNRIMIGKLRLDPRATSITGVVRAAVDAIRPAITAKNLHLSLVFEGDAEVHGDPDRLQQALWNLLNNAVKFTPRGGEVRVSVRREEGSVAVSVADSGEGIAPAFLPYVFDRFRQADASAARRHGGLGLGLAIVRSVVEMHGGTVRVDSEGEGRGSTFTLVLPTNAAPSSVPEPRDRAPGEAPAPRDEQPSSIEAGLSGARLLVVDDEPDSRELVERILTDRGAEVLVASGAEEALAMLDGVSVDLLLSDVGMPQIDGYELMRRVRRRDAASGGRVPAVALTAFARAEDRARALENGFDDHVPKPIDPSILMAAITRLVRPARSARAGGS